MLHIRSEKPNTNDETNRDHYNLAMFMLGAGVGEINDDKDRVKLVSRVMMLGLLPSFYTIEEFADWVLSFGVVHTNSGDRSNTVIMKQVREHHEFAAKEALIVAAANRRTNGLVDYLLGEK